MKSRPTEKAKTEDISRFLYDPEPASEEDLWFLPGQPEDRAPTDPPWPLAPREGSLEPEVWLRAEQAEYRSLVAAVTVLARYHERLATFPVDLRERFALKAVDTALRIEGIWLGVERIALYQALRVAGDDEAQNLSRAGWAVRRLLGTIPDPCDLRDFLGRRSVDDPENPGEGDRAVGAEFDRAAEGFAQAMEGVVPCHDLTRAAYAFACWRREGITPWDETLEPTIAAMRIGAGEGDAVPLATGTRLDHHDLSVRARSANDRLRVFYKAVEEGALERLLELDRLKAWCERARDETRDLSGRTPPKLIEVLLRYPLVSAELVAEEVGTSRMSARRNLNLFVERGLAREVTGQERFRFWGVKV